MSERNFMQLLRDRWSEGKFVCVGLDSNTKLLPSLFYEKMLDQSDRFSSCQAQQMFNDAIIEATKDLVCAYKPNLAYYRGGNGKYVLRDTIVHINQRAPGVPVILDVKQGDIGSTNDGYVEEDFGWYGADAVTINPYLGIEGGLRPFFDDPSKGVIVLCKTSNKGSGEFQDLEVRMQGDPDAIYNYEEQHWPLYRVVAHTVSRKWNYNGNCGLVVGATYPEQLADVRQLVGDDMPILIPGIGAQGGELEATLKAGFSSRGRGVIINSGRSIIFASNGEDYAEAARRETLKLHDSIRAVLAA